jgi:hypothetical protein
MVGDIIKKQFVEEVMDKPKELGNMTPYPQKEAENNEEKAELDQLSSNQLSRARVTSSNGLVLPLLMMMHYVFSRDESDEAGEVMAEVDMQDTESCLCPVLQMGSGTGPLYKYLRSEILTTKMCQVTKEDRGHGHLRGARVQSQGRDGCHLLVPCTVGHRLEKQIPLGHQLHAGEHHRAQCRDSFIWGSYVGGQSTHTG